MRALVVYESMYGNTRRVAEAIGRGLASAAEVTVTPLAALDGAGLDGAALSGTDLLVVGGPTHAHGLSRPGTRRSAVEQARRPGRGLSVEPGAAGRGLREWFATLGAAPAPARGVRAAAFDTRVRGPAWLTGRASRRIVRELRQHGFEVVGAPESFTVTQKSRLAAGEEERAHRWGEELAANLARR